MVFSVKKWLRLPFAGKSNFHEKSHQIHGSHTLKFVFFMTWITYEIRSISKTGSELHME